MSFTKVCSVGDIWEGEMEPFTVDGHDILLVGVEGGEIKAFQGICPHQDIALSEGKFDGKKLICRAHLWQFDAFDDELGEMLSAVEQATPAALPDAHRLEEIERQAILQGLREHQGNRTETAKALGISRRALIYKLQRFREQGFEV